VEKVLKKWNYWRSGEGELMEKWESAEEVELTEKWRKC